MQGVIAVQGIQDLLAELLSGDRAASNLALEASVAERVGGAQAAGLLLIQGDHQGGHPDTATVQFTVQAFSQGHDGGAGSALGASQRPCQDAVFRYHIENPATFFLAVHGADRALAQIYRIHQLLIHNPLPV